MNDNLTPATKKTKKPMPCRRCGCDMTFRERYGTAGFCFVCAPVYGITEGKIEMNKEEQHQQHMELERYFG